MAHIAIYIRYILRILRILTHSVLRARIQRKICVIELPGWWNATFEMIRKYMCILCSIRLLCRAFVGRWSNADTIVIIVTIKKKIQSVLFFLCFFWSFRNELLRFILYFVDLFIGLLSLFTFQPWRWGYFKKTNAKLPFSRSFYSQYSTQCSNFYIFS